MMTNVYEISNARVRARSIVTNKTPSGSYRGWGQPHSGPNKKAGDKPAFPGEGWVGKTIASGDLTALVEHKAEQAKRENRQG